ncbi:MAG TPA: SPOR domain-containing protein [Pyrinomonadaceae bacterium]|jgi:cell division septation protein DedD|nr:SPOR domain-containing protein [Pyrinomonadaceae bacterium]
MAHEENLDGAGVEIQTPATDHQQPHVLDAFVVEADPVVVDAVAEPDAAVVTPAAAPDFYAVGVRLIKMSPVWLLTLAGSFALLLLVLSWVRPAGGDVDAASIPNDSKSIAVVEFPDVPAAAKPSVETPVVAAAPAKEERAIAVAETKAAEQVQPVSPAPAHAEVKPVEQKKEPAKVVTPASDAGGKFTVQVGSFSVESQANERISSLRAAGFDARSTVVQIPGRGTWYRVQVGRFRERDAASKAAAQLREKGAAASSMVVAVE